MNNSLLVEVTHTGDELGEQTASRVILQVSVVEDVVEELATRRILKDDANVPVGLNLINQANNVWV